MPAKSYPTQSVVFAAGEIPTVRVEVGWAHLGQYTLNLWDKDEKKAIAEWTGNTKDAVPDQHKLVSSLDELDGKKLFWVLWIKTPKKGKGSKWSFGIFIEQGGQKIGRVEDGGAASGFHALEGEFVFSR